VQQLVLQNTVTFAQTLIKNQQLNINNLIPGITFGDLVLQRMLGAPFKWRFNRGNFAFNITKAGGTDYNVNLPDLGAIEVQWLTDDAGAIYELNGAIALAKTNVEDRPLEIAPQYDDNKGNITFRVKSIPDQNYTVWGDYQRKAALITSFASPWGTVSDEFSYIFNWGYVTLAGMLVNDSRFPIWEGYFINALLGAQDGLDDQARDIFLGNWMQASRTITRNSQAGANGVAGRGR
jgi:hypothetical protein